MIFFVKIALFIEALQLAAVGLFRRCLHPRYRDIVTAGDMLVVASIPVVGLFGYNKNVFYGFLFVLPLLWVGDPGRLAKRYVLALVLFPELAEVYQVGGAYLGTFTALIAFNAGALAALAMTRRGKLKAVRSVDAALWALFIVALLLFARGVPFGGAARYTVTTFLLIVPSYYIVARAISSPRTAGDTVSFIVLGGVCNGVVGMFESVRHWPLYESFNQGLHVKLLGLSGSVAMRAGLLRAQGPVATYETLGLVTGTSLLAVLAVRRRFTPLGFYTIVAVLVGGLFASQARSAWIATLVGLALYAVYERRWNRVALMVGGFGVPVALIYLFSSSEGVVGQLLGKSGHGQQTAQYRQGLLDRSLEEVARHPFTGQTLDQLQVSMNDLRQGEHIIDFVNTHVTVMLVGGVGAFLLWLLAWGSVMAVGWRSRPKRASAGQAAAALPFAMLGLTFVFLTFTSPTDRIFSVAAIAMGLMSTAVRVSSFADGAPKPLVARRADRPGVVRLTTPVLNPPRVTVGAAS